MSFFENTSENKTTISIWFEKIKIWYKKKKIYNCSNRQSFDKCFQIS